MRETRQSQGAVETGVAVLSSSVRALAVIVTSLAVGLASLGLADELWSETLRVEGVVGTEEMNVEFVEAFTNDDGVVNDPTKDPNDNGIDPGHDKDVGSCTALIDPTTGNVSLTMSNGYPSYTCRFWTTIQNVGSLTLRRGRPVINALPVLTLTEPVPVPCATLDPGEREVEEFTVHIEQEAEQGFTYQFTISKKFFESTEATIGFWDSWDSHMTFSQGEIEGWLAEIDATSAWFDFGPSATIEDMEAVFAAAQGRLATPQTRFLANYLSLRLNERSCMLVSTDTHDVTAQDPDNYLGLATPTSATLAEIIAAIESKASTGPTDAQFNIMKDVSNALNGLAI